jgi:septum formation protein
VGKCVLTEKYKDTRIILASQSPRRKELVSGLNIPFEVLVREVDESFPEDMAAEEVPLFLSKLKATVFQNDIDDKTLVITADTVVIIDGEVLGKPNDFEHAFEMLRKLSGRKHVVITGVCITSETKQITFSSSTDVYFKDLTDNEISYYLANYKPFDKAGSYGVQEWIGYIAIERIEGSYFNVMGLPVQRLYEELLNF